MSVATSLMSVAGCEFSQLLPPRGLFPRLADRKAAQEEVVWLGGSWLRVHPFETRRHGEARTSPPRTVGQTSMVVSSSSGLADSLGPKEAVQLSLRTPRGPRSTESAEEKVVFCNRHGETLVYQADRRTLAAALCACGNATGASAALLAHYLGRREVRQRCKLPNGAVEIRARVTPVSDGGWHVVQSWSGIHYRILTVNLNDREVIICTGTFNDYLIVRLENRNDLASFDLPDALALWSAAQQYGGFEDPLRSRLVAISPASPRPYARFYTCGRIHPGAPLTGLATLAVASQVNWLAALLERGEIEHRRGLDPLPALRLTPYGPAIGFPAIQVVLHGILGGESEIPARW